MKNLTYTFSPKQAKMIVDALLDMSETSSTYPNNEVTDLIDEIEANPDYYQPLHQ